jgi:hypothetical protein
MDIFKQDFSNFTSVSQFINTFHRDKSDIILNYPDMIHSFPFASVGIYFLMVMILPMLWGKRVLPGIKIILALWNGFLSVLSVAMFLGMVPAWISFAQQVGVEQLLCSDYIWTEGGSLVFWAYLFLLSKYAELLDTLWLILSGKPVPFLVSDLQQTKLF